MMRPRPRASPPRGDGAAPCAQQILELVPRAMRLLRGEMRQAADPGLSVPQFRGLAYLGRAPGASLSALAEHLGVAAATASAMVARLVQRGLVARSSDPAERRRVRLSLTAQGAALLGRARTHTRARVEERLRALSAAELAALGAGLTLLDRTLGGWREAGGRP